MPTTWHHHVDINAANHRSTQFEPRFVPGLSDGVYVHVPHARAILFCLLPDLDNQFFSCTHDVLDVTEPTETHRDMQVGNRLHQNLFYACLAGNSEAVHERPTDWNLGQKGKNWAGVTY